MASRDSWSVVASHLDSCASIHSFSLVCQLFYEVVQANLKAIKRRLTVRMKTYIDTMHVCIYFALNGKLNGECQIYTLQGELLLSLSFKNDLLHGRNSLRLRKDLYGMSMVFVSSIPLNDKPSTAITMICSAFQQLSDSHEVELGEFFEKFIPKDFTNFDDGRLFIDNQKFLEYRFIRNVSQLEVPCYELIIPIVFPRRRRFDSHEICEYRNGLRHGIHEAWKTSRKSILRTKYVNDVIHGKRLRVIGRSATLEVYRHGILTNTTKSFDIDYSKMHDDFAETAQYLIYDK